MVFEARISSPVSGSQRAQPRHVVAAQDPADRARRDTEFGAEPVLTAAVLDAGRRRPAARPRRRCGSASSAAATSGRRGRRRLRRRTGRPNDERTGATPPSPWRHERRAFPLADAMHEQPTTVNSETGVTVRHEDLLVVKRQTPQCPEVFTRQRMSPTSRPGTSSPPGRPVTEWVTASLEARWRQPPRPVKPPHPSRLRSPDSKYRCETAPRDLSHHSHTDRCARGSLHGVFNKAVWLWRTRQVVLIRPPSITKFAPVTLAVRCDARNTARVATSSGVVNRPVANRRCWRRRWPEPWPDRRRSRRPRLRRRRAHRATGRCPPVLATPSSRGCRVCRTLGRAFW